MTEPLAVAAIGLGRWANVLAQAYSRSEHIRLVTCFSRGPERRERFAARFGCAQDASLEAVLARADVEAVVVTVPNDRHADVVEKAAAAGKHVYVEKPIAVTVADARRIEAAVRHAGVKFLCGHSARRVGGLRAMKQMIDSGRIGRVSMAEAVFSNERGLELQPGDWRGDPLQAPGGVLTQLGVHQIDNLQYLLGPVVRVFNFGKAMHTRVANATVNQTVMEFENGCQAYLGSNWACPGVFYLNVYATQADLFYELDFSWWSNSDVTDGHSTLRLREFQSTSTDPDGRVLRDANVPFEPGDHLRDEMEDLWRAVREDGRTEVDAGAALRNLAVVLAAVRSAEERRAVEVAEILGA